jgi:hypothetical protein
LQNGKKLELALQRDGSRMNGTVGSDAGSATIQGEFSGSDVYWEIAFQDSSKVLLRGQLGNGEGGGVSSQAGNESAKMKWTARTAVGCARWPDGKALAAQEVAKPQQAQTCAGGMVGTPPNCRCPAGKQWNGRNCVVLAARPAPTPPAPAADPTPLGVIPNLIGSFISGGGLNLIQQMSSGSRQGGGRTGGQQTGPAIPSGPIQSAPETGIKNAQPNCKICPFCAGCYQSTPLNQLRILNAQ